MYMLWTSKRWQSIFINAIIKEVTGEKDIITTSQYPAQTLKMIDIRFIMVHLYMIRLVLLITIKWLTM